jgi:hypothetical protein
VQLSLEVSAQIAQTTDESVFFLSGDGSTFVFRGDQAKFLRDGYAEEKQKSKWDMRVQVTIVVDEPTGAKL